MRTKVVQLTKLLTKNLSRSPDRVQDNIKEIPPVATLHNIILIISIFAPSLPFN